MMAHEVSFMLSPSNERQQWLELSTAQVTAKVAQRQGAARSGIYVCNRCHSHFHFSKGTLRCPLCKSTVADDLVPFYTEESPEAEMLGINDFQAGD